MAEKTPDFLKHFSQLSAIVVRQTGEHILWLSPLARYKLPPDIAQTIQRL
ncbi:MAG: hypothetical protein HXY40_15700 [Chloroflexi bacterium]|nr:hypothetical protein [Chloroflexota bacterium]